MIFLSCMWHSDVGQLMLHEKLTDVQVSHPRPFAHSSVLASDNLLANNTGFLPL